jgi:hypothetical protein
VPARVEEDPEVLALTGSLTANGPERLGVGLRGVEIVDQEIEMDLLRDLPSGQVGAFSSPASWNMISAPSGERIATQSSESSSGSTLQPRSSA